MAFVRVARLVTKSEVFSELPKKPVSASILSRTAHAAKTSVSSLVGVDLTSIMPTETLIIHALATPIHGQLQRAEANWRLRPATADMALNKQSICDLSFV